MEKNYILLRSGKQLGPFSLQELVQFDLQPLDLVWFSNDVVGWRYASEIESLHPYIKNYVPEPVFVKENLENENPATTINTDHSVPEEINERELDYASASSNQTESTYAQIDETYLNKNSEEIETEPAVQDRSNMPVYERSYSGRQYATAAVTLDSGYGSFSGNRKAKNISRQGSQKKQMIVWAAGFLILIAGSIAIYKFAQQDNPPQGEIARTEIPNFNDAKASAEIDETTKEVLPVNTKEVASDENEIPTKDEAKVINKPVVENTATQTREEPKTSELTSTLSPAAEPRTKVEKTVDEPVNPVNEKTSVPITSLVTATSDFNSDGQGISALNIKLYNKSDKVLKMAAVNVFYTDSTNTVLNKQTLYFSNIQPGQTVSKGASPHKIATKAYSKVGLVSTEGSIFYEN